MDAQVAVCVLDVGYPRVQKFSGDGTYLMQWGRDGTGNGQFVVPGDLAVDGNGNVYVNDGTHCIQVFSSSGAFLRRWRIGSELAYGPERVAVDARGTVFVTDWDAQRVKKFSSDGQLVCSWKTADERWKWTPGLAADARGHLYVTDAERNRVLLFAEPSKRFW